LTLTYLRPVWNPVKNLILFSLFIIYIFFSNLIGYFLQRLSSFKLFFDSSFCGHKAHQLFALLINLTTTF
jgi:hypothetical protein